MPDYIYSSEFFGISAVVLAVAMLIFSYWKYDSGIWEWVEPFVILFAIIGIGLAYSDSLALRENLQEKKKLDSMQQEDSTSNEKIGRSDDSKYDMLRKFYIMLHRSNKIYGNFCYGNAKRKLCNFTAATKAKLDKIIPLSVRKTVIVPPQKDAFSNKFDKILNSACIYIRTSREHYKYSKYILYFSYPHRSISKISLNSFLSNCAVFYGGRFHPKAVEKKLLIEIQKDRVAATDPNSPEYIDSDLFNLKNVWWHFILLLAALLQLGNWNANKRKKNISRDTITSL